MRRRLAGIGWTVACVGIGWAWGSGWRGAAQVASSPSPGASPRPEAQAEALAACRRSLALAGGVLDAQLAAANGTPAPFPPDLPPQYRAEGFEAAIRAAVAECEPDTLQLVQIDCAEYPCAALFHQPAGTYNHALGRLTACDGWTSRFAGAAQGNGTFQTDDGPAEFSILAALPTPGAPGKDAQTRWRARYEAAREAAMEAAGGREPTELEALDQEIAFWTHAREGGFGDPAALDEKIAALRAAREALGRAP